MTATKVVPPTVCAPKPIQKASGGKHKATKVESKPILSASPSPIPDCYESHPPNGGRKSKATTNRAESILLPSPAPDHMTTESYDGSVGGESDTSHLTPETHEVRAGVVGAEPPTTISGTTAETNPSGWLELRIWAEMLHDAQEARKAAVNRAERGGVDPEIYTDHIARLQTVEHGCALVLRRTFRRVAPPEIVAWQKAERGVGEHLLARLLGHLGDPYIATPHAWLETPPEGHACDAARCGEDKHLVAFEPYVRKVSQLWSYCGVGDPLRKRRAGMTQEDAFKLGSPICKMLIHLLAEACMKQPDGNLYRDVYTRGRVKYSAREGWKPIRQHNAALRLVKKELLRDLWLTRHRATDLEGAESQESPVGGDGLDVPERGVLDGGESSVPPAHGVGLPTTNANKGGGNGEE